MDGLMMLLIMAAFFGLMYLYCWLPEILGPYKEKKKAQRERKKDELRKKRRATLLKTIDKKNQVINSRREKIQDHYDWLQQMNNKIKKRFDLEEDEIQSAD